MNLEYLIQDTISIRNICSLLNILLFATLILSLTQQHAFPTNACSISISNENIEAHAELNQLAQYINK